MYSLYDVDCIASIKTFTRLVGKGPAKPPDDAVFILDGIIIIIIMYGNNFTVIRNSVKTITMFTGNKNICKFFKIFCQFDFFSLSKLRFS